MYIQTICKPFSINALGQYWLIIANFISIENLMLLAVLLLNVGYLHSRVYLIPPLRSFCYTAVPPPQKKIPIDIQKIILVKHNYKVVHLQIGHIIDFFLQN